MTNASLSNSLLAPVHYELNSNLSLIPIYDSIAIAEQLATMDPWLRLKYQANDLAQYLTRPDHSLHRYAIEYNGCVSGMIGIRYPWLKGPYIELLGIFPKNQGCGIGRTIINWLSHKSTPSSQNLWVMVSSFNIDAQRFYISNDFHKIAAIPNLVRKNTEEIMLRRILI